MDVLLHDIGKRFNRNWIIKNLNENFEANSSTGIIGANGSGKSTLIKMLTSAEIPSSGKIIYKIEDRELAISDIYKEISITAPYIELPQYLTVYEVCEFQLKFKSFLGELNIQRFLEMVYLDSVAEKQIQFLSTGMQQRLKLGLSICCNSKLLLLDEPCNNLDKAGIQLYHQLLNEFGKNKTIVITSNEKEEELHHIDRKLNIADYKQ